MKLSLSIVLIQYHFLCLPFSLRSLSVTITTPARLPFLAPVGRLDGPFCCTIALLISGAATVEAMCLVELLTIPTFMVVCGPFVLKLLLCLLAIILCLTFFSGCNKIMLNFGRNKQQIVTVALKLKSREKRN